MRRWLPSVHRRSHDQWGLDSKGSASRGWGLHPGVGVYIQGLGGMYPRSGGVCIQVGSASKGESASRGSASRKEGMHPGRVGQTLSTMGYGQQVGSTHPTGMHSCCELGIQVNLFNVQTGAQVSLFHCQKGVPVSSFHRQKCLFCYQKYV